MNEHARAEGRSVLIVDDDRDTREMYGESLRSMGFDVSTASSAEAALRAAAQAPPAVLVTDLRLGGTMDGSELARRLRQDDRTKDTRIIMLTGAAFGRDRDRADTSVCDRVLVKPCLPEALASEIREISDSAPRLPQGGASDSPARRGSQGRRNPRRTH